ncbi:MAG TPA: hypothetical protein VNO33_05800 [Kofleriaceae bacterium]|nr:hypothetical protein [Kofleriaceae bacterium]
MPLVRLAVASLALALAAPIARAEPRTGHDFRTELALLHRVVACVPSEVAVPAAWVEVVDQHCAQLGRQTARFRERYVDPAVPFLAAIRPADLSRSVVYPFGGGDLASALVTYPEATDITTISLEYSGDPRQLAGLSATELRAALSDFRTAIRGLLTANDSATSALQSIQRGPLPGQVCFFLTALAVFGHRPISLRYFRLEPDGSIHYYSSEEIEALAGKRARKIRDWGVDTDHSVAFSNAELVFERSRGDRARVVHRHVTANLDDSHLRGSPLEKHLVAKGRVAAMTKAASYLLWTGGFTVIRDYLLRYADFMISDSTGIPPRHARQAGFQQVTYGRFTGPFLRASEIHTEAFAELWRSQPYRRLKFRYGYPDADGNFHLLVTRRAP